VAFDFTEEDFAPKSKHDFSEEDFEPAPHNITPRGPPVQPVDVSALEFFGPPFPNRFPTRQPLNYLRPAEMPMSVVGLRPKYRGIEGPIIQTPDFTGTDFASGLSQSVKTGVESMTSPLAIATAPLMSEEIAGRLVAGAARPLITGTFAGLGAKGAGQALGTLAGTPEPTGAQVGQAVGDISQSGLMMLAPVAEPLARKIGEKPTTEVAQPKEIDARTLETPTEIHGPLLSPAVEGEGKVPIKEGEPRVQPKTEGRVPEKEAVGKTPTADQLLAMTPEESVTWKRANQYGPEVSKGIAETLTPEDAAKLDTQSKELQKQSREMLSKLKPDDNEGMAKTMNVSLKAQTLREIGEDYKALQKEKPTVAERPTGRGL